MVKIFLQIVPMEFIEFKHSGTNSWAGLHGAKRGLRAIA